MREEIFEMTPTMHISPNMAKIEQEVPVTAQLQAYMALYAAKNGRRYETSTHEIVKIRPIVAIGKGRNHDNG